jgi:hypothetical protein
MRQTSTATKSIKRPGRSRSNAQLSLVQRLYNVFDANSNSATIEIASPRIPGPRSCPRGTARPAFLIGAETDVITLGSSPDSQHLVIFTTCLDVNSEKGA